MLAVQRQYFTHIFLNHFSTNFLNHQKNILDIKSEKFCARVPNMVCQYGQAMQLHILFTAYLLKFYLAKSCLLWWFYVAK